MPNQTEEKTISQKLKRFVVKLSEIENEFKEESPVKTKAISAHLRSFKRTLGLEKSYTATHNRYKSRTILKYISTVRKYMRQDSSLLAADAKEQVKALAKNIPEISEVVLSLLESDNIKEECRDIINRKGTPHKVKEALKCLQLEHSIYYRLRNTQSGRIGIKTVVHEAHLTTKREDARARATKNQGESKKSLNISRAVTLGVVKDGLKKEQVHATRMALALILCTGRRNIELLKTGSFEATSKSTIRFTGQAKKKLGATAQPYEIPVMFSDAKTVVECFNRLRNTEFCKSLLQLDNEWITTRTNKTLNDAAKTQLLNNDASFYTGRSIYATESYGVYLKKKKKGGRRMTQAAYIANILGHDENDVETAVCYGAVQLDPKLSEKDAREEYRNQKSEEFKSKPKRKGKHSMMNKLLKLESAINRNTDNPRSLKSQTAIAQWLIEACKDDPDFSMTATNIRKLKGGRMAPIKDVLRYLE